jgi:hypothetical protein
MHHQRDSISTILKETMVINTLVLFEMDIPHIYLNPLLKVLSSLALSINHVWLCLSLNTLFCFVFEKLWAFYVWS